MAVARGLQYLRDSNGNQYLPVRDLKCDWSSITLACPNATTEVYTYFDENNSVIQTITVIYTDATMQKIVSVTKA